MDIFGSYTFDVSADRVWDLLMDPAALSSCIPGCTASSRMARTDTP
jgi:carbon monoxide dehydrogenase subunit G